MSFISLEKDQNERTSAQLYDQIISTHGVEAFSMLQKPKPEQLEKALEILFGDSTQDPELKNLEHDKHLRRLRELAGRIYPEILLRVAKIRAILQANGTLIPNPLRLAGEDPSSWKNMDDAELLVMTGAGFPESGFRARHSDIRAPFKLNGVIGGDLSLSGCTLHHSLDLSGARVKGNLNIDCGTRIDLGINQENLLVEGDYRLHVTRIRVGINQRGMMVLGSFTQETGSIIGTADQEGLQTGGDFTQRIGSTHGRLNQENLRTGKIMRQWIGESNGEINQQGLRAQRLNQMVEKVKGGLIQDNPLQIPSVKQIAGDQYLEILPAEAV